MRVLVVLCVLSIGFPRALAAPESAVTQGIPGTFDANVAEDGGMAVSTELHLLGLPIGAPTLPFPNVTYDYGLTDKVTVGTHVLGMLALGGGGYGPALKMRFIHAESESFRSTVTVYGGMGADLSRRSGYVAITDNFVFTLGEKNFFKGHASFFKGGGMFSLMGLPAFNNMVMYSLGAGYARAFSQWFGLDTLLLVPLHMSYEILGMSYEGVAWDGGPFMLRIMPEFRVSKHFLISTGWCLWRSDPTLMGNASALISSFVWRL